MKVYEASIYFGSTDYFCGVYSTEEKAEQAALKAAKHVDDPCQYHMRPSWSEIEIDQDPLTFIPHCDEPKETYHEYRKTQPMHPVFKQYLDSQKEKQ